MFARVLEMKTKRGQARALCTVVEQKILPIVKKFHGFLDGVCMIPGEAPDSAIVISFWQNREAAERFRAEGYAKVAPMYEPFLEGEIHIRGCDVPFATAYKARAAKAS
jgi:quinol monooxygenase YgiN